MRAGHAELGRVFVHQVRERVLGTGDVFGQRDRRVVAGLDDHAVEQVLERHLRVHLQERGRAVGAGAALAPGMFADQHRVFEPDLAGGEFRRNDVAGHHLGDRGRLHAFVGIVLREDLAGGVIHQHPALGVERRWRRRGHVERPGCGARSRIRRRHFGGFRCGLFGRLRRRLRGLFVFVRSCRQRGSQCGKCEQCGKSRIMQTFHHQIRVFRLSIRPRRIGSSIIH
jgi:hypothetical protein